MLAQFRKVTMRNISLHWMQCIFELCALSLCVFPLECWLNKSKIKSNWSLGCIKCFGIRGKATFIVAAAASIAFTFANVDDCELSTYHNASSDWFSNRNRTIGQWYVSEYRNIITTAKSFVAVSFVVDITFCDQWLLHWRWHCNSLHKAMKE